MTTNNTLLDCIIFIAYCVSIRYLLTIFVKTDTRIKKVIIGSIIWCLYTIGTIFYINWIWVTFGSTLSPAETALPLLSAALLGWNIMWLFIFIVYSFMQSKRNLSQKQKSILQDL